MTMGPQNEEETTENVVGSEEDVIRAINDDDILPDTLLTNFSYNLSRNSLTSTKQQARQLVVNVCEYFKKERENKGPLLSTDNVLERTCEALKLKETVIFRLTKRNPPVIPRRLAARLHPLRIDAIKNFIILHYKSDPFASMPKVYKKIVKNGLFVGSYVSFRRMLHQAGFQFTRGPKRRYPLDQTPFKFEDFSNDVSNELFGTDDDNSGEEDVEKFEPMEGLECEKDDLDFFKSVLPAVSKLSDQEKMNFRLAVMNKIHSLLYETSK